MKTFKQFLLEAKQPKRANIVFRKDLTPEEKSEISKILRGHNFTLGDLLKHGLQPIIPNNDLSFLKKTWGKYAEKIELLNEETTTDIRTLKKGQKFKFKNSKDNNTYIITRKFNSNSLTYDNVNTKEHYIWDWSQVHERDVIVESKQLNEAKNENFEGLSFDELYKELGIKKDKFKIVKYDFANSYGIKVLDKDNNECVNVEVRDKYKVYYNDHNKEKTKEFKNFDDMLKFVKSISKTILVESKQLNESKLGVNEFFEFEKIKFNIKWWENGEVQITSSHPYDLAEYHWAKSKNDGKTFDIILGTKKIKTITTKSWERVEDEDLDYPTFTWTEIANELSKLDKKVKPHIDRT